MGGTASPKRGGIVSKRSHVLSETRLMAEAPPLFAGGPEEATSLSEGPQVLNGRSRARPGRKALPPAATRSGDRVLADRGARPGHAQSQPR